MSPARQLRRLVVFALCGGLAMIAVAVGGGLLVARDLNRGVRLTYLVTPVPDGAFEVELRAYGLPGRRPELKLLDGWGFLQDQPGHLVGPAVTDAAGSSIRYDRVTRDGVTRWKLDRGADEIRVRYRVRPYEPTVSPEASFADDRRFLLLGYSLFLIPDRLDHYAPADVLVEVEAPENWPLWASWDGMEGVYLPGSLHDLWSGVAAGGAFVPTRLGNEQVAVTVLTEPAMGGTLGLTIANRLLPVLREAFALFDGPPRRDALEVLALYRVLDDRPDWTVLSGTSEEGAFLCLATPDRFSDPTTVTALAVHECLHFYLGGAVTGDPEPPYRNAPDLIWLVEGVTEYLTFELMHRAGVLGDREWAAVVDRKKGEYHALSGARGMSLAEAGRRMEETDIYPLVYSRGYLVARLLDRTMREACGRDAFGETLRGLVRDRNFYRTRENLTLQETIEAFAARCPQARAIIERYAVGNEELPAPAWEPAVEAPRAEMIGRSSTGS